MIIGADQGRQLLRLNVCRVDVPRRRETSEQEYSMLRLMPFMLCSNIFYERFPSPSRVLVEAMLRLNAYHHLFEFL